MKSNVFFSNKSTIERRLDVDGLRAIAVAAVIGFHSFPGVVSGGFLGVDIFFVISGFVITQQICSQHQHGNFNYGDYFFRRARRLLPSLLVVLIACLFSGTFIFLPGELLSLAKHVLASLVFLNNFQLISELGYFDATADTKPLLHTWSLGVEAQFYVFWPVIFLALAKWSVPTLFVASSFFIASFITTHLIESNWSGDSFFHPVTRIWEILLGAMLGLPEVQGRFKFLLFQKSPRKRSADYFVRSKIIYARDVIAALSIAVIAWAVFDLDGQIKHPGFWTFVPLLAVVSLISLRQSFFSTVFLSHPLMVGLGTISYPLYLWHWPILVFCKTVFGEQLSFVAHVAIILTAVSAAIVTYFWLEVPIRRCRRRSLVIAGIFVIGVIIIFRAIAVINDGGVNRYNEAVLSIEEAKGDWNYPGALVDSAELRTTSTALPELLLIGDSHIEQYGPRITNLYSSGQSREVGFLTAPGCPIIPGVILPNGSTCSEVFDRIERALESAIVNTIVIGFCFNCYFLPILEDPYKIEFEGGLIDLPSAEGRLAAFKGLRDFLSALSERYRVILLTDVPFDERFHPDNLLATYKGDGRRVPLSKGQADQVFRQSVSQLALADNIIEYFSAEVTVVSQHDIVCPEAMCIPTTTDGRPIYKDSSHFRPFYSVEEMHAIDKYLLNNSSGPIL